MMASTNNPNSEPRKTYVERNCAYEKFKSYQLSYFNGTDGAVGLIRWFKQTESIFSRSKCAKEDKVRFAVSTLTKEALGKMEGRKSSRLMETVDMLETSPCVKDVDYITWDLVVSSVRFDFVAQSKVAPDQET
ncbi:hypothetical protein Tco_0504873 [Tanacetum coccineum]